MSVQISIVDILAEIIFEQTYTNTSNNPIEAVYSLILPLKTAISNFVVTLDDRKVKGVVREKEKAAEEYEDAIATGGSAFLVEKSNRKDVNEFTMSVGSLKEGKSAKVELTFLSYLDVLETDKSIQRFRLPVELLPSSVNSFFLTCSVWTYSPPLKINVSHGEISEKQIHTTHVVPSSDFVVEIQTSTTVEPQAVFEIDPINTKSQAVMITHFPSFSGFNSDFFEPKTEIIFVVDRSGSMSGDRINQTRVAMNMLIHAIPQDSIFNIIGFGSSQDWLFPQSVPYTANNLKSAESKVNSLSADLGGTDLLSPLRDIFSRPINPDYPRIIYVLTDGAVDDRGACIAEVKRYGDEIRLYALGIGSGVDRALVTGIAEAGRGREEFVVNNKDIEEKVMKLFSESLAPCFNKLKIEWGGDVVVEQSPPKIMALRSGDRMIAYGLVEKGNLGNTIKVTGVDPEGNKVEWDVPVVERKGELVKKLTAFALIRDLQEKRSRFHLEGSATDNMVKKEIVRLGVEYQLASEHTSFIATVDSTDNDTATGGTIIIQKVKNVAPPEPELEEERCISEPQSRMKKKRANILPKQLNIASKSTTKKGKQKKSKNKCKDVDTKSKGKSMEKSKMENTFDEEKSKEKKNTAKSKMESITIDYDEEELEAEPSGDLEFSIQPPSPKSKSPPPPVTQSSSSESIIKRSAPLPVQGGQDQRAQIVSLQKFDGSWEISSVLSFSNLGKTEIDQANPLGSGTVEGEVWATAIAIAYLEVKCVGSKSTWEMVAKKGKTWMQKVLLKLGVEKDKVMGKVTELIEKAIEFFK